MRLSPAVEGDVGEDIAYVQRKLGVFPASGVLDDSTAARVRGWQHTHSLEVTGQIDRETFDAVRSYR